MCIIKMSFGRILYNVVQFLSMNAICKIDAMRKRDRLP